MATRRYMRSVTQTVLVRCLLLRKNVDERILIESEGRELSDVLEQFALDLPVLDPHFLEVNVVVPHAGVLLAL